MSSVFKVRLPDGSVVDIPALKGLTPVKGVDYWTEEDKAEIQEYIDNQKEIFRFWCHTMGNYEELEFVPGATYKEIERATKEEKLVICYYNGTACFLLESDILGIIDGDFCFYGNKGDKSYVITCTKNNIWNCSTFDLVTKEYVDNSISATNPDFVNAVTEVVPNGENADIEELITELDCAKYFSHPKVAVGSYGVLIDLNYEDPSAPYVTIPPNTHFVWDDYMVLTGNSAITIPMLSPSETTTVQLILVKTPTGTGWPNTVTSSDSFCVIKHDDVKTVDWSQYRLISLVRILGSGQGGSLDIGCGYTINGKGKEYAASVGANSIVYCGGGSLLYVERVGQGIYIRPQSLSSNINIVCNETYHNGGTAFSWDKVLEDVGEARWGTSPNGMEKCIRIGVNADGTARDGEVLVYWTNSNTFAITSITGMKSCKAIPLVWASYKNIGGKLLAHNNDTAFERLDAIEESLITLPQITNAQISKIQEYAALFNNTDKVESFAFFTDPHLSQGADNWQTQFKQYLSGLKNVNDIAPCSFVVCGGDWLGNSDLMTEACYKLSYIDGYMRNSFNNYHLVVGNHDTNYQGKLEAGSENYTGTLTQETLKNLWYRDTQRAYYRFEGAHSDYYVLNTLIESSNGTTDYEVEQLKWFANSLKENNSPHTAIFMHMYIKNIATDGTVSYSALSTTIGSIIQAYNARTSIEIGGKNYDFSSSTGHVDYVMCGHTHKDYIETIGGVPCVVTTHLKASGTPEFDLCLADYDNNKLHLVRVGSGKNRTIDI